MLPTNNTLESMFLDVGFRQQSSDKQQSGCCHHHQNPRKLKSSQLETKGLNRIELLLKSLTRHT